MVVVSVLAFDLADGVACRAEAESVGVDVVGDASRPVVSPLRVARFAPVVAAVFGSSNVAFAAMLLHCLCDIR